MHSEQKNPALQLVFNILILFALICTLLLRQTNLLHRLHSYESQEKPTVFVFNLIRPEGKTFFQPKLCQKKLPKNAIQYLSLFGPPAHR